MERRDGLEPFLVSATVQVFAATMPWEAETAAPSVPENATLPTLVSKYTETLSHSPGSSTSVATSQEPRVMATM